MRIVSVITVVVLCCGCAGPNANGPEGTGERVSLAAKTEAIEGLVAQSDVIVLGKITGIRDATARDAGIVYDIVLDATLYGEDVPPEVLRFSSTGRIGYAEYRMDEDVLLFLRRDGGEFTQIKPVCYIAGKPTPSSLDLEPLSQYRDIIDKAIQNQIGK